MEDHMNNLYNSDSIQKGYYGYSSEANASNSNKKIPKNRRDSGMRRKLRRSTILGLILVLIQAALSGYLVYTVMTKKFAFITPEYLYGGIGILAFFLLLTLIMEIKGKLGVKRAGKVISILISLLAGLGIYLLGPWSPMSGNKVDESPFVVFVSASDTFGALDSDKTNSRSDTNIIAAVNPKKHTVMMVSVPRDYYIPIVAKDVAPGSMDKLTHIGLYGNGKAYDANNNELNATEWNYGGDVHHWGLGRQAIMDSLKSTFNFNIDKKHYHFAEINFTGFAKVIDELGGINVHVDESFSTKTYASYGDKDTGKRKKYKYKKGDMEMDGATALTFARERHSFSNGDMQRNKNQVKVIKAMSKKILSPSVLFRYNGVVNAVSECYDTDMDVSSLVDLQRKVSGGWQIVSFGVIGDPSRQVLTWNGLSKSVVMQDVDSIEHAHQLLNDTLAGKSYKKLKKQAAEYEAAQK